MKILVYLTTGSFIIDFRKGFFKCGMSFWAWQADQKIPLFNGNWFHMQWKCIILGRDLATVISDLLTKFHVDWIEIANVMSIFVYINT